MSESYESLEKKTVAMLRQIIRQRGIVGFARKTKHETINAILNNDKSNALGDGPSNKPPTQKSEANEKLIAGDFKMSAVITKPNAKRGDRATTTIQVSCGANSSAFPVVGKSVGAVQEFLKEVLNVNRMASGQVNGEIVKSDYILKEADVLEFIKPAGRKG